MTHTPRISGGVWYGFHHAMFLRPGNAGLTLWFSSAFSQLP
jgi:hypothetical protein